METMHRYIVAQTLSWGIQPDAFPYETCIGVGAHRRAFGKCYMSSDVPAMGVKIGQGVGEMVVEKNAKLQAPPPLQCILRETGFSIEFRSLRAQRTIFH